MDQHGCICFRRCCSSSGSRLFLWFLNSNSLTRAVLFFTFHKVTLETKRDAWQFLFPKRFFDKERESHHDSSPPLRILYDYHSDVNNKYWRPDLFRKIENVQIILMVLEVITSSFQGSCTKEDAEPRCESPRTSITKVIVEDLSFLCNRQAASTSWSRRYFSDDNSSHS